ncbi:MAG: multidrug ABC transporter substrate-binding protein [Acidobacteria bacterium]|nr:MAG: multidrug ABC transporter substrate-binding protein [Acidobacteriota bacterium]
MNLVQILRIAMRALARNKLRSALTMLGIIIGVAAVIAMVSVGQGAQQQAQDQIAAMGSNVLFVGSGAVSRGGMSMGWGATKSLVYDDMTAILHECPAIAAAAPGTTATAQVVYGNDNWNTRITGTEPQFFDIKVWNFQEGGPFLQADVESANNVAVIGETVRKNLFGATDPLGQTIRVNNLPFKVVGVLDLKGTSPMGDDQDDTIVLPVTTVQKKMNGQTWLRWIMVSAVSREASYAAQKQISAVLRDRHRIRAGQDDDFFVRNLADFAQLADEQSRLFTILLASIASISLVVGGIGIMNIMLVSVTERTREIGIRMAIGATEGDVQQQFLIEAIVLSLIGGAVGIALGLGASSTIANTLGWPVLVSSKAIVIAAVFSAAIGIFFGFYPARKAARLDPIDALRYE